VGKKQTVKEQVLKAVQEYSAAGRDADHADLAYFTGRPYSSIRRITQELRTEGLIKVSPNKGWGMLHFVSPKQYRRCPPSWTA